MNAVRPVGASRYESVKEYDVVTHFPHGHVVIACVVQFFGELGEFVIVRGEDCLRAHMTVQVLGDCPRYGDAVIGGRATSYLVQEDKAARRRTVENGADLTHFHQERGLAPPQVVTGTNPREYPVHHTNGGRIRRNERTDLCQDHAQSYLP